MKSRFIFTLCFLGSGLLHGTLFLPQLLDSPSSQTLAFTHGKAGLLIKLESVNHRSQVKQKSVNGDQPRQVLERPAVQTAPQSSLAGVKEKSRSALLIAPEYPEESRLYQEEGTVVVEVSINQQARAQNLVIISSSQYERLDQAVLTKLRETIFKNLEGEVLELSFKFELESRD